MSLAPGARFGVFEIVSPLGAGGMGEVYRARDTRLGRDVALKVLPDLFAQDADRLSRFQREAQLLASLNHSNIAAIHGLEDVGGVRALVLELIEGDTLADRISRGPVPVEDAVSIARQIAEALEAAHERGVIHRDLKPANVKITPDGKVKVLDFGLAKALESAPAASKLTHSPTLSLAGTFAGVILGTAAYMSPEQAKGLPADQRSDVFSFGCVVFEMLTGRQAFQADTATEILAAVLMREPDLQTLPPDIHPRLAELVRRCLDKNPKRRWQAVGDIRYELDAIAAHPRAAAPVLSTTTIAPAPAARAPLWRRAAPAIAAASVCAVAASAGTWWLVRPSRPPLVTRFALVLPDDQAIARPNAAVLALSPDGSRLVYGANRQLYLRSSADMEARPIPGTLIDPTAPFFSPDGEWIGFFSVTEQALKKIAVTGGAPLTLCRADNVFGASWYGDQIVFAQPGRGVMRVSANGGEPEVVAKASAVETAYGPQLLGEGRILFSVAIQAGADRWEKAQIVAQTVGADDRKILVRGGSDARYVASGHLVYVLGTTLLAVPFDVKQLEVRGGPIPVVEQVGRPSNPAAQGGLAQFAVSAAGALAYLPSTQSGAGSPRVLALFDRQGKVEPIGLPPQAYIHPRLSPDGRQLVVGTDDGKEGVIWVYDLKAGGSLRRLTFGGRNQYPIWSPDGRYITFQSDREGDQAIFRQLADGSSAAERLTRPEKGVGHEPEAWSPDGKVLSMDLAAAGNQGIWTVSFDRDQKPAQFVDTPSVVEKHSAFSPDGRWIAYMSNTTAANTRSEVFIRPFPPTGAQFQVSTDGGRTPLWSRDGRQLFYHEGSSNRIQVVDIRTEPSLTFGKPMQLPIQGTIHPVAQRNYDLTPDGKQLLVVVPASSGQGDAARRPNQQINVVLNWLEELKARAPVSR